MSANVPRSEKLTARKKAEAENNQKWEASFAATSDEALKRFADKIRADIAAGKTKPGGFGKGF